MRYLMLFLLVSFIFPVVASDRPIIDMHFHAWPNGVDGPADRHENLAHMNASLKQLADNNVVLAATSGPEEFLQRWSAEEPDRLILGPIFPCDGGLNPNNGRQKCFRSGREFPDLDWLERQYMEGRFQLMGELTNQYAGIPYDDPRMEKYYALAERLEIPVAFHTHSGPPLTSQRCCPKFRMSLGDPILLEEILIAYPKLKIQIMHANVLSYPILTDMMVQYPQIYVDLTPFQQILPREYFHRILRIYKDNRLLKRVMFGSDGANYKKAIAAYTSADFLSEKELEGIFCRNAARFLGRESVCGLENGQ